MPMPFDATLKDLAADYPDDFLTAFDQAPTGPLRKINVDLSTVTTAGDIVYGIGDPLHEITHIDFQASADINKGADLLVHSSLLFRQYRVPIHGILVLLRPKAEHSEVNGTIVYAARPGRGKMHFGYEIIRLWERSAESLLAGPLGVAPLAMLGALPEGADLTEGQTGVAQRLVERLQRESQGPGQIKRLLTSAFVLTGLRVRANDAHTIFGGIKAMRESETYMAIIDEGREIQSRQVIRRLARRKLGEPDEATITRLEGITDIERLDRIIDRAADATAPSWQELLDTP